MSLVVDQDIERSLGISADPKWATGCLVCVVNDEFAGQQRRADWQHQAGVDITERITVVFPIEKAPSMMGPAVDDVYYKTAAGLVVVFPR